jgi:YVTN family beta-propeller protein
MSPARSRLRRWAVISAAAVSLLVLLGSPWNGARGETAPKAAPKPAAGAARVPSDAPDNDNAGSGKAATKTHEPRNQSNERKDQIVRQGLKIAFALRRAPDSPSEAGVGEAALAERQGLTALQTADLSFTITDTASNQPVRGLAPGAWIDKVGDGSGEKAAGLTCNQRVGLYLSGRVGMQPLIDANSYLIVTMNRDSTLSVIDPNVVIGGTSNVLYDQVILKRPGEDWVLSRDRKRLFVTMPRADAVAVIDAEKFELITEIQTGPEPMRIALQPDGRFVWIGTNARGQAGGVTIVDTDSLKVVAKIETGKGHHEIAFSDDDRLALISNRKDGTVTLIDVQGRVVLKQMPAGKAPIAVAYSSSGRSFYAADGETGTVHVIAADSLQPAGSIQTKPGLGPMQMTGDGRWLLVTNATADEVHVIDTSGNTVTHSISVKGKPYQLSVTRAFAYVRTLESERVSMINLSTLDKGDKPLVTSFVIGSQPPAKAGRLPIASSIVEAAGEAGVVAVDPVEGALLYYMEGMTAPMGTFRSLGGLPRGILVVDRLLAETKPGVYSTRIQLPAPGQYEAAFVLDSPKVVHCFTFQVAPDPLAEQNTRSLAIEYLAADRRVAVTDRLPLRFRLVDPAGSQPRAGLSDVQVLYFRSPGRDRAVASAADIGDGMYEAPLALSTAGAWYIYVSSLSAGAPPGTLPFFTIRATAADAAEAGASSDDSAQTSQQGEPSKER